MAKRFRDMSLSEREVYAERTTRPIAELPYVGCRLRGKACGGPCAVSSALYNRNGTCSADSPDKVDLCVRDYRRMKGKQ